MLSDGAFASALSQAAALLDASRCPVVAGLQADLAGATAAIRLARLLGGAVDHAAHGHLCDVAVLQDAGLMLVSPGEARQRADAFLLVGDRPLEVWPGLPDFLFGSGPAQGPEPQDVRRIVALSSRPDALDAGRNNVHRVVTKPDGVPAILGAVRAVVNGRPLNGGFDGTGINRIAATMKDARYGVAIWSPGEVDALTVEMLAGLVKDLNAETRWAGLSVADDVSAIGASMAAGWMTGMPLRSGFASGEAEHDPWRFDARRLVESGEADAVVWISTFGEPPPRWTASVSRVLISDLPTGPSTAGAVNIPVGRTGRDHAGILLDRHTGTLLEHGAASGTDAPTAADALNGIARLLEGGGAA